MAARFSLYYISDGFVLYSKSVPGVRRGAKQAYMVGILDLSSPYARSARLGRTPISSLHRGLRRYSSSALALGVKLGSSVWPAVLLDHIISSIAASQTAYGFAGITGIVATSSVSSTMDWTQ